MKRTPVPSGGSGEGLGGSVTCVGSRGRRGDCQSAWVIFQSRGRILAVKMIILGVLDLSKGCIKGYVLSLVVVSKEDDHFRVVSAKGFWHVSCDGLKI